MAFSLSSFVFHHWSFSTNKNAARVGATLCGRPTAAWRTMLTRVNRAARYGAPFGIYIAKTKPECENTLNSTSAILTQIAGNAK